MNKPKSSQNKQVVDNIKGGDIAIILFDEMMERAKKQGELLKKKQESIDISQVPF